MPMRLPRITIGRLMIGVAVAGLALALYLYFGVKTEPLARGYRALADEHAIRVYQFATWPIADAPGEPERTRARVAYHQALSDKYEHAARYPWLPISPDPPPPD